MSTPLIPDGVINARLAEEPLWAAHWVLIGKILYAYICIVLSAQALPVIWDIMQGEVEGSGRLYWLIYSLPVIAFLVHMMMWSEQRNLGPFAGNIGVPQGWPVIAIWLSPAIFFTFIILAEQLFAGGDPNWAYGEEGPPIPAQPGAYGISMFMAIVILAPLAEEIAFRGVGMGFLLGRGIPPLMGNVLISIIFAATHTQYALAALMPVFLMSMYFGWLRTRTGSVGVPVLAHMAANGAQFLAATLSIGAA